MGTAGHQQTIARLVDEHYVGLYRYAYRLTGSSADAEDLTQDEFLQKEVDPILDKISALGELSDERVGATHVVIGVEFE